MALEEQRMSSVTAAPAQYEDFAQVDAYIRSLGNEELRAWLESIPAEKFIDIHRNRYYPIYMNMYSLFRGKRTPAEIQGFSIEATKFSIWMNHCIERYLASLAAADKLERTTVDREFTLSGWDFNLIESLLRPGKGLVIASFRFGLSHGVPLELAIRGFNISLPLISVKYRSIGAELAALRERVARGWSSVESPQDVEKISNLARLKVTDLQEEGAALVLAETLKKNEIQFIFIDGNNGADGPWGGGSRVPLDFMGLPCAAKSGMARLAAFSGASILPVLSVMRSPNHGELFFGKPIIPPPGMGRQERESFSQTATVQLYQFLERFMEQYPGQWAGISALHRWRVLPEQNAAERTTTPQEIAEGLDHGNAYRISAQSSLLPIPAKGSEVWVDLSTLRSIQVPPWARDILPALSGGGLDREWLDRFAANGGSRNNVFGLIAELCNRNLVAPYVPG
jgi:hypothetical protein